MKYKGLRPATSSKPQPGQVVHSMSCSPISTICSRVGLLFDFFDFWGFDYRVFDPVWLHFFLDSSTSRFRRASAWISILHIQITAGGRWANKNRNDWLIFGFLVLMEYRNDCGHTQNKLRLSHRVPGFTPILRGRIYAQRGFRTQKSRSLSCWQRELCSDHRSPTVLRLGVGMCLRHQDLRTWTVGDFNNADVVKAVARWIENEADIRVALYMLHALTRCDREVGGRRTETRDSGFLFSSNCGIERMLSNLYADLLLNRIDEVASLYQLLPRQSSITLLSCPARTFRCNVC